MLLVDLEPWSTLQSSSHEVQGKTVQGKMLNVEHQLPAFKITG